jgi:DnaJ-class molecular chaperone
MMNCLQFPLYDVNLRRYIKVRKATQPGDQLRLRGRGLPELGSRIVGDLFIRFQARAYTRPLFGVAVSTF